MNTLTIPMEVQTFALLVAVSGGIVSGLVLLAARLLRRRSAPLQYGVLLGGIFGLLAIPALVGVGLNVPVTLLPAEEAIVKVSPEMLHDLLDPAPLDAPPASEAAPSLVGFVGSWVLIVWTFVASAGLARLLFGLWKQQRAIIGQPWSAAWWTEERRACLAAKVGLNRFPAVHHSPVAPIPMVVGLMRPKIVLPEQAPVTWGQPQWEAVLLHEAAHIARRDPWAALAQCLAVILFWWCPFVHLMARRLNDLREVICDDYALEGPCDRLAYAELLVESAERLVSLRAMPVSVGLIDSARGGLEERITHLLAKEKEPMQKSSFTGKLLGAGFLAAACLLIPAATAFCQPPAAKKVQIKIIVDGKEFDLNDANLAALLQRVQPKPKPEVVPPAGGKPSEQPKLFIEGIQLTPPNPPQPKPDPRIEELVRQAEAIKPGAGAEIRRALQATPKPADPNVVRGIIEYKLKQGELPTKPGTVHWEADPGKHVIVLTIDANGKVVQLQGVDLKKFLDKNARFHTNPADPTAAARENDAKLLELMKALQALGAAKPGGMPPPAMLPVPAPAKTPPATYYGATKPVTPSPAPDVAALARQIERLTAELQEIRKRLDDGKREAK